jgi:hypothetical protein
LLEFPEAVNFDHLHFLVFGEQGDEPVSAETLGGVVTGQFVEYLGLNVHD